MSPIEKRRYEQVARIHKDNIDQGFLSTLGVGFLALMYRAIDEAPDAILLVEEEQGTITGFVSGAKGMGSIYRQMFRHLPQLVIALAPTLLRPRSVWRIIEILRHSTDKSAFVGLPPFELLSISVPRAHRRKGIAQRLYARLADHFSEIGAPGFCIVVGSSLSEANPFYTQMGAQRVREITIHGHSKSHVYLHDLAGVTEQTDAQTG